MQGRNHYVQVRTKFLISTALALCWLAFSIWISIPWMKSLGEEITLPLAVIIISFIALIPGFLVFHLLFDVLLDRQPPLDLDIHYPPLTLLIAAFNEEENIAETFRGIKQVGVPG